MKKLPLPSLAQAKRLAELFNGGGIANGGYVNPTDRSLMKREWASPTGIRGTYPNGSEYEIYRINHDGLYALERFLFEQRSRS